jgi:hypothetical protein
MLKKIKTPVIITLVAAMLLIPFGSSAFAQSGNPSAAAMIADTVVARPLGFGAIIAGTAGFIVSLPFSALGGNVKQAFNKMMVQPTRFTFLRPIGVF